MLPRIAWFLALGIVYQSTIQAQVVLFGQLIDHIEAQVNAMPGASGNQYRNPSVAEAESFSTAIGQIMSQDLTAAVATAEEIEYQVIRFVDHTLSQNQEFVILQKAPGGQNHWGTFIYNPLACRNLVIQCPHPVHDTHTGFEGAYVFTRLRASALLLSGTHRCNSNTPSSCSGTTSVCGSAAAYRISDIAHNDHSMFQHATEYLSSLDPDRIFIQLHGFARIPGDPHLIMSNGTRDTPEMDLINTLRISLLELNPAITFRIVHMDTDWTRLTAFTNTQGRFLNGSPDPCTVNATNATGRFVHIEQEYDLFRADESGWDLMFRGLEDAVPCGATAVVNPDPVTFVVVSDGLVFEGVTDEAYRIEIYLFDGRLWWKGDLQDRHYPFPPNTISVLVVRSTMTGLPVLQHRFCFFN
jgi:hypothetical protein